MMWVSVELVFTSVSNVTLTSQHVTNADGLSQVNNIAL